MPLSVLYLTETDIYPSDKQEADFCLKKVALRAYLDADIVFLKGELVKDVRKLNHGINKDKLMLLEEVISDLKS